MIGTDPGGDCPSTLKRRGETKEGAKKINKKNVEQKKVEDEKETWRVSKKSGNR